MAAFVSSESESLESGKKIQSLNVLRAEKESLQMRESTSIALCARKKRAEVDSNEYIDEDYNYDSNYAEIEREMNKHGIKREREINNLLDSPVISISGRKQLVFRHSEISNSQNEAERRDNLRERDKQASNLQPQEDEELNEEKIRQLLKIIEKDEENSSKTSSFSRREIYSKLNSPEISLKSKIINPLSSQELFQHAHSPSVLSFINESDLKSIIANKDKRKLPFGSPSINSSRTAKRSQSEIPSPVLSKFASPNSNQATESQRAKTFRPEKNRVINLQKQEDAVINIEKGHSNRIKHKSHDALDSGADNLHLISIEESDFNPFVKKEEGKIESPVFNIEKGREGRFKDTDKETKRIEKNLKNMNLMNEASNEKKELGEEVLHDLSISLIHQNKTSPHKNQHTPSKTKIQTTPISQAHTSPFIHHQKVSEGEIEKVDEEEDLDELAKLGGVGKVPKFEYHNRMYTHRNIDRSNSSLKNGNYKNLIPSSAVVGIGERSKTSNRNVNMNQLSGIVPHQRAQSRENCIEISPFSTIHTKPNMPHMTGTISDNPNLGSNSNANFNTNTQSQTLHKNIISRVGLVSRGESDILPSNVSTNINTLLSRNKKNHTHLSDHSSQYEIFSASKAEDKSTLSAIQQSRYFKVNDYEKYSPPDLSKKLFEIINNAPENSIIEVPPRHITVPHLIIKHPLLIRGSPGTLIEIKNGNIIFDFHNPENKKYFRFRGDNSKSSDSKISTKLNFKSGGRGGGDIGSGLRKSKGQEWVENTGTISSEKKQSHNLKKNNPTLLETKKAIFSECSIVFNIDISKWYERVNKMQGKTNLPTLYLNQIKFINGQIYLPLVLIHDNTFAEFRDSDLRAVINQQGVFIDPNSPHNIFKEVAFWFNGIVPLNNSLNSDINEPSNRSQNINTSVSANSDFIGTLSLKSCIITHFYSMMQGCINATVSIEKCHITECRDDSINLFNPKALKICNSLISKSGKAGVNIKWLQHSNYSSVTRKIFMKSNAFLTNGTSALHISSLNKFSAHNLKIYINNNKIQNNRKDGIFLSKMAITDLEISENEFNNNVGSGMWIEHIHHKSNKFVFKIKDNNCRESMNGFGMFLYDCGMELDNNTIVNNHEGGLMIKGTYKPTSLSSAQTLFLQKYPLKVKINNCEISENGDNGVVIQNFWKGPVVISNSKILNSAQNGIYVTQNEICQSELLVHKNTKTKGTDIVPLPSQLGVLFLEKNEISKNGIHGVYLNKVVTHVHDCVIVNNIHKAIYLPQQEYKHLLRIRDLHKFKTSLQGQVGGPWGNMFTNKPGICSRNNDPTSNGCRIL